MTLYPFDCTVLRSDEEGLFHGVRYAANSHEAFAALKSMASDEWPAEYGMGFVVATIHEEDAKARGLPWAVNPELCV